MGVPIVPSAGAVAWGSEASIWGAPLTSGTVTSAVVTLAPGWWLVKTGAHNTVVGVASAGTTTFTFGAASTTTIVPSDGATTLIINDGTGGTAANYAQLLGGMP